MKAPTLQHRLEYLAYRVVGTFLGLLPESIALLLGEGLGWTAGVVFRIRRRDVDRHLRIAFPERDDRWRRRVARRCFRHLGREGVAIVRLDRAGREEVVERTEMVGFEALVRAVEEGKGAIVVTGHMGNWEVGGASLATRGIPLDVVAQRQSNPLFDTALNATRERLGMRVIERGEAPRRVLRSLRRGRVVALVADQNVREGGVFVDFFGKPAATARGPAVFALRTGAPVFLGIALRQPGLRQWYRVTLEPIPVERGEGGEEDVRAFTALHTRRLEEWVRRFPGQYFWQHRRWKTRPPGEAEGSEGRGPG